MTISNADELPTSNHLCLRPNASLEVYVAGLQISRGTGPHIERRMGCFDLIFVREGVLPIQEEQQTFRVVAGQTLLLWPHRHHWGTGKFSPDMRLYWLHFNLGKNAETPLLDQPQPQPSIVVPQYSQVARPDVLEALFRRLLDDQATKRLVPHYASLLLNLMLCEIADQRAVSVSNRRSAVLAGRALAYIRAHLHQPITASIVAESLGYRAEYLNRHFHQTYNHTVTQEIHLSRMGYARYLLHETSQNINEIAANCGFRDANYFARLFKRQHGMTATAYRHLYAQAEVNVD